MNTTTPRCILLHDASGTGADTAALRSLVAAIATALGLLALHASAAGDSLAASRQPLRTIADVPLGGRPTRLDNATISNDSCHSLRIWATAC
jgi:hypothetical protein